MLVCGGGRRSQASHHMFRSSGTADPGSGLFQVLVSTLLCEHCVKLFHTLFTSTLGSTLSRFQRYAPDADLPGLQLDLKGLWYLLSSSRIVWHISFNLSVALTRRKTDDPDICTVHCRVLTRATGEAGRYLREAGEDGQDTVWI